MYVFLGLGVVLRERSFFHGNERNYQEQSHCCNIKNNPIVATKKNEHIERVLKNIGTIYKISNMEQTKKY